MTKLYELTDQYKTIEGMFESEFVTREEIQETLKSIKEEIGGKVESIAKIVLSQKASIEAIKAEEDRLSRRREAMHNNMEWLKVYLLNEMVATNTLKVKRDLLSVAVADNPPSVEIVDLDLIPEEYRQVIPETWQPNKKSMIEHFKATGEIIIGTDIILDKKHVVIR